MPVLQWPISSLSLSLYSFFLPENNRLKSAKAHASNVFFIFNVNKCLYINYVNCVVLYLWCLNINYVNWVVLYLWSLNINYVDEFSLYLWRWNVVKIHTGKLWVFQETLLLGSNTLINFFSIFQETLLLGRHFHSGLQSSRGRV